MRRDPTRERILVLSHLALTPQQLAAIDFTTFDFPGVELVTRTSGEDLLILVWAGGRAFLLHNRDVPRDAASYIDEIRSEVQAFNADPVSGWRDLIIATHKAEMESIAAERQVLTARRRAAAAQYDDAGFALMRARRATSR